jgi:hypothetical protein
MFSMTMQKWNQISRTIILSMLMPVAAARRSTVSMCSSV